VKIVRTFKPTGRPYELSVETKITNLSDDPKKHAFSEALYALQFKKAEGGLLHRPGPNDVFAGICSHDDGKIERKDKGGLRQWFLQGGKLDFVAISSSYLSQAIVPTQGDAPNARCALVGQDRGVKDTDSEQTLFNAVLAYDAKELKKGETATYAQLAFFGPKERDILKAAAGGRAHLDKLIELGTFAFIAQYLVMFVVFLHGIVKSWGLSIVVLTVTVRMALMPLTLPQIRSSIAMRRLRPEIDEINKKFEGDQQAKMLATSQLYKKAGVNPLSGCLPSLVQLPVWWALYTSLQTAIELYHEPFLIWRDLSAPDARFILPLILGAVMFLQQKITPMQMDPAQQKIFTYFMPAMFTVFMLFLPTGLGVYMLTNSVLGIVQTLAVERYYKRTHPAQVVVTQAAEATTSKPRPVKDLARRKKDSV
jgi:YidC/Oxa1 family membrane protein insertase